MAQFKWLPRSIAVLALLTSSISVSAAPTICKNENLGAGADKMTCIYAGQSLDQAYQHVRGVLDGGVLLREAFPQQAVSDDLPENNDEGLVNASYAVQGGTWVMNLGYQGGETKVLLAPKGNQTEVVIVMSAD